MEEGQQQQEPQQQKQKLGQHQALRTTLSGKALVGHRIKVWWPADQAWYSGTVKVREGGWRREGGNECLWVYVGPGSSAPSCI